MTDQFTLYFCPVCGHVEWVVAGEELPEDYHCPLCEVGRDTMIAMDDPRLQRHGVALDVIAENVWRCRKAPAYRRDYEHFSYVLNHPDGLVLYDPPPFFNTEAVQAIQALGSPRLLVVSHADFVGFSQRWAEALQIPIWMGTDDPLPGNRVNPDRTVTAPESIGDGLEMIPVPGHSPGSLALYWSTAPGGPLLCCGDALGFWPHRSGEVQFCFFQDPPIQPEVQELVTRPISLLACCTGLLKDPGPPMDGLRGCENACARPWRGDPGGFWWSPSESIR